MNISTSNIYIYIYCYRVPSELETFAEHPLKAEWWSNNYGLTIAFWKIATFCKLKLKVVRWRRKKGKDPGEEEAVAFRFRPGGLIGRWGRVHAPRSTLGSTVMVPRGRCWWWLTTMFQGHPPLPPPASLPVRFAITDLHRETLLTSLLRSRCPISLSFSLFPFLFLPSIPRSFIFRIFRFFCSRTSFWLRYRADYTIFHRRGRGKGQDQVNFCWSSIFFSKLSSSQTRNTWHFSKNWNFIYAKRPRGK